MDLQLKNKACIVTGASRGIGAASARMLEDEGARVLERHGAAAADERRGAADGVPLMF